MPLVEKDYSSMQNMIFGDAPDFDDSMMGISELESEINSNEPLKGNAMHVSKIRIREFKVFRCLNFLKSAVQVFGAAFKNASYGCKL